jgi:hypothetical protein
MLSTTAMPFIIKMSTNLSVAALTCCSITMYGVLHHDHINLEVSKENEKQIKAWMPYDIAYLLESIQAPSTIPICPNAELFGKQFSTYSQLATQKLYMTYSTRPVQD